MSVTVQADCVYAFKCAPNFGMGMIGFVVIGDAAVNLEEVEGLRYAGRTKKVAAELIEQIKASGKPRARISSVTAIGSGTFITAPNRWEAKMAKDLRSEALLPQECFVEKMTGKVIEASNNKIRLTRLPKAPAGMEIAQVDVIVHARRKACQ